MEIHETGFNNILVGTELFVTLGIRPQDVNDPTSFGKIREIADFLNSHPDPLYVIGLAKYNKNPHMSNLDYLTGYVKLQNEKQKTEEVLKNLDKQLEYYGR